jgi:hypothetical protein
MKNKFKMAILAISMCLGVSATATAGWSCESAGYQCIQQGNQSACVYLSIAWINYP